MINFLFSVKVSPSMQHRKRVTENKNKHQPVFYRKHDSFITFFEKVISFHYVLRKPTKIKRTEQEWLKLFSMPPLLELLITMLPCTKILRCFPYLKHSSTYFKKRKGLILMIDFLPSTFSLNLGSISKVPILAVDCLEKHTCFKLNYAIKPRTEGDEINRWRERITA